LNASQVDNDSSVTGATVKLALEHLDSTKVPTTRTLTINGTTQDLSANRTFTIATGLAVGTTPITSGTVGRVLFEGTGNVLQESANFFWDNTNSRLGIGTATPAYQLSLSGSANIQGVTGLNLLVGTRGIFFGLTGSTEVSTYLATSPLIFSLNQGSTPVARFSATNGNFLIGTTTDAGYKLDVNGSGRILNGSAQLLVNNATYSELAYGTTNYFRANGASAIVNGPIIQFLRSGNEVGRFATTTGNFLINTTTDIPSSILTLASNTKGFLPPRMTNAQRLAIASPAVGLIVYCTDVVEGLYINKSTGWTFVI
jgi:hypothetical protein